MRPSWKIRRRVIVATLIFCGVVVGWLAVAGEDTRLAETIATGLILLAASVIGSYVFGATWDDANVMKRLGASAYGDTSEPFHPPPPERYG